MRATACMVLVGAALLGACASQGIPPGGPPDTKPPVLLRVSPESGSASVTPPAVEFRFDEVVSERPRGAPSLEQLVIISPSEGPVAVDWRRDRLTVRPRRGWRPNTAYSVTVLPGLVDLRGNAASQPFRTVFATGASIPTGVLRGVAFDWLAGRAFPGARVEAMIAGDTLLKYTAAADSMGRYALGTLPPQRYLVRAWIDVDRNGVRDPKEPWDTVSVTLADSARNDLYTFPHDTTGPRISEVSVTDSMTIRVKFSLALRPVNPIVLAQLTLMRDRDSSVLALRRILPAAAHDSVNARESAARADSMARADTTAAGRLALVKADSARARQKSDSAARAQIEAIRAARDTTPKREPPIPLGRPVPPSDFVIVTAVPIPVDTGFRLVARDVQALLGSPRTSTSPRILRPKPPPVDSTLLRRRPPPDSAAVRRPPPPGVPPTRPPFLQ